MTEPGEHHVTTLRKCSCQHPRCSGLLCRHQFALYNLLFMSGLSLDDIHGQLFHIKQTIATVWLKDSHTDEGLAERELAFRRALLHQVPRGGVDGEGAPQRVHFTQSELVRYGINQARPTFEMCIGETEMNLFLAYINDYNKSRRPTGTRTRASAFAPRAARRVSCTPIALRRHEPTRAAGRARRAR